MGLEAVVEEIRGKGKTEADAIRAESKKETDVILAAANKRVAEIKLAAETEAAKQAAHIMSMEASAANLLVKREQLNAQKDLLDQVYQATLAEIAKLPESFHREALKKLLAEATKEISRGTIRCNARDVPAVKSLIAANKEFAGFTLGAPVDIEGGIIVEGEGGGLKIDYSYRTFLSRVWESGLKDASDILFA
ncbi:MAG TPA: V-type ATP synthase subunit E family protein [Methanoregulaceae archaeon]|nr:V-type ATP synthase subunit E family protein [Methanoregulaceae archaeon]HPD75311.1 V-type ATP synthase subunit E family protein [Methanoregulaceae archaeon]